jgi:UDP-N-acetylglucosamine 1-carboxyvinyltransferase
MTAEGSHRKVATRSPAVGRSANYIRVMSTISVEGGRALSGNVRVRGAKNAVLKEMVSTLLAPGRHHIANVPSILDVEIMAKVLGHVGGRVEHSDHEMWVVVPETLRPEAPIDLVRQMRDSIVVLGPLLARCGEARVALPGGDDLGSRPIEWHLEGLERMGASFELVHGVLVGKVDGRLKGTEVELPFPSVGATVNVLFAGILAEGDTVIVNAAREPEIEDLVAQLNAMGARIDGVGTSIVNISGVDGLSPTDHTVIADRLEAGTYAVAAAITGGEITVTGCNPAHLRMELLKLEESGCEVERGEGWLRVKGVERPSPVDFATLPYPGFHTDMHPQMVALLSVASGVSVITENLYDSRFRYVGELLRMGADITIEGSHAVINGVDQLSGCPVLAPDIRAGAALVIAGLRADGVTEVGDVVHIDRGYENFVGNLAALGAQVERT